MYAHIGLIFLSAYGFVVTQLSYFVSVFLQQADADMPNQVRLSCVLGLHHYVLNISMLCQNKLASDFIFLAASDWY